MRAQLLFDVIFYLLAIVNNLLEEGFLQALNLSKLFFIMDYAAHQCDKLSELRDWLNFVQVEIGVLDFLIDSSALFSLHINRHISVFKLVLYFLEFRPHFIYLTIEVNPYFLHFLFTIVLHFIYTFLILRFKLLKTLLELIDFANFDLHTGHFCDEITLCSLDKH